VTPKSWNVSCWDDANNLGISETRNFTITGGPFITINSPENASQLNGELLVFNYSAQDLNGVNNCSFYFDNDLNQTNLVINDSGGYNYFNLTNVSEGNHSWQITCFDNTGLLGVTNNFTLFVDNTAPGISLFYPNGHTFNSSLVNFNFTAVDNYDLVMSCNLTVDGLVHPSNENFDAVNNLVIDRSQSLSNGNHVWSVTCVDNAGNINSSYDYSFITQDSVAANVTLTSDKVNYVANQIAHFTTTVLDSTSTSLASDVSIVVHNTSNEDIWSYAGLPYRTRVNLTNSIAQNLTGFTTNIIIDTFDMVNDELMQTDCSDLRFADNKGTPINFYLASGCGTSNTVIWLKVDIEPLETKSFYYYHGNASFVSSSNNSVTFANIEVGTVNVSDENFVVINLAGSFSDPVVIASPEYEAGPNAPPHPAGVIIKNVNSDFFQIKADRPNGVLSNNVTIHYMVVDRGSWVLFDSNSRLLVDSVNTTVDGYSSGNYGSSSYAEEVTFSSAFNGDPLVFASRNTEDNSDWAVGYVVKPGDLNSYPNTTSSDVGLSSVQLGNQDFSNGELVGWIGVETGLLGNTSSTLYSTDRSSSANVEGWDNSPFAHSNSFGQTYSSTPEVIIVMTQTINGGNGGWASLAKGNSTNTLWYSFVEESTESDRSHASEYIASFSFENAGVHGLLFDNSTTSPSYVELDKEMIIAKSSGYTTNGIFSFDWNTTGVLTGSYGVSTRAIPNSTFDLPDFDSLIVNIINDEFGPNITLLLPQEDNMSVPGSINFTYNVSDDNNLVNCSLFINGVLNQTDNSTISSSFDGNFTTSFIEGIYNWSVACYDILDNLGISNNRTLYIDNSVPVISLNYPINEIVLNSDVIFNYSVFDNFANNLTCELRVDGFLKDTSVINNSDDALIEVTNISDGVHDWDVTCFDFVNNQGSNSSGNFTVDTEPLITLDSPEHLFGQESENISLGYLVTDISLNNCSLLLNNNISLTHNSSEIIYHDSSDVNYFNVTNLTDGIYNWSVMCFDNNGLSNSSNNRLFHIDNDYPVIDLVSPLNDSSIYSGTVTFVWNASDLIDPVLDCSLIINDSVNKSSIESISNNLTNVSVSGFSAGEYSWRVSCDDQSSHTNSSITNYFIIESTPQVTLIDPADNNTFDSGNDLELIYLPTGVEGFDLGFCDLYLDGSYSQTDATITEGSNNNFSVTGLSEGSHTWMVNCTDSSGGNSFDGYDTFYVDLTNPEVSLHSPDGDVLSSSSVLFNWTATDNLDDELLCDVYVNDSLQSPSQISSLKDIPTTNVYSGFVDGTFFWNVTCFDNSLRSATSSLFSFTVQEIPSIILGNPVNNFRTTSINNDFFFTPSDNSNSVSSCELIIDGVINQSSSSIVPDVETSLSINSMSAGLVQWSVNCTDPSSNEGASEIRNFIIDLNGPQINLTSPFESKNHLNINHKNPNQNLQHQLVNK